MNTKESAVLIIPGERGYFTQNKRGFVVWWPIERGDLFTCVDWTATAAALNRAAQAKDSLGIVTETEARA